MTTVLKTTRSATSSSLYTARALTILIVLLATVASAGGLFLPGLYRDPANFVHALRGQDLVTLIAMPAALVTLLSAGRGSARAKVVWMGLLGYLLYTYMGASVAYAFNEFFLIYVALFSMSVFAIVALATGIDMPDLHRSFDAGTPRKPVAVFLALIALMLGPVEVGQIVSFITTGTIPEIIVRSGGTTCFVYVLDLGMVVPLLILSAAWLWRGKSWGYMLAGVMLIKGATMGLALLSMEWFAIRVGQPTDGLELLWAVIAFGSLAMSVWFLRHCRK